MGLSISYQHLIRRILHNEDIIRIQGGRDSFPPPFDFVGLSSPRRLR